MRFSQCPYLPYESCGKPGVWPSSGHRTWRCLFTDGGGRHVNSGPIWFAKIRHSIYVHRSYPKEGANCVILFSNPPFIIFAFVPLDTVIFDKLSCVCVRCGWFYFVFVFRLSEYDGS